MKKIKDPDVITSFNVILKIKGTHSYLCGPGPQMINAH